MPYNKCIFCLSFNSRKNQISKRACSWYWLNKDDLLSREFFSNTIRYLLARGVLNAESELSEGEAGVFGDVPFASIESSVHDVVVSSFTESAPNLPAKTTHILIMKSSIEHNTRCNDKLPHMSKWINWLWSVYLVVGTLIPSVNLSNNNMKINKMRSPLIGTI